jgi:acyl carrier protein
MTVTTEPGASESTPTDDLRAWIRANLFDGRPSAGFDDTTDLVTEGVMDSLAIMSLLTYLEGAHGAKIEVGDIIPENFSSVNAIAAFLQDAPSTPSAARSSDAVSLEARGRELIAAQPHLTAYSSADYVLAPYINCSLRPNTDTGIIRTDAYGYRVSHDPQGIVDSQSWFERPRRALALGNSFTLGWGCTGDKMTLPSQLNSKTPYSFLNLGIAAASSLQEAVASIPFLEKAELVLIASGLGNLVHNYEFGPEYDLYGAFYPQPLFLGTRETRVEHLSAQLRQGADGSANGTLARNIAAHDKRQRQWTSEEIKQRFDLAAQHHFRDLRLLVQAVQPGTPILYAMQPTSSLAKPELAADEQALLAAFRHYPMWKDVFEPYVMDQLSDYIEVIAGNCDVLDVPFIDLNEIHYQGICFVDYGHTTDAANEQIASYLADRIPS